MATARTSNKPSELPESAQVWAKGGNAALVEYLFLLNLQAGMVCPACKLPCGHIYKDEDTPGGACLSCKIDADLVDQQEALHDEEAWAETCCTCGID